MGRESVIHANADLVEGVTEAEAEAPPEGFARYACLLPLLSRMMMVMMIMMMIMMIMMMIMMIDPRGYIICGPTPPSSAQGTVKGFGVSGRHIGFHEGSVSPRRRLPSHPSSAQRHGKGVGGEGG
jgi:hypothetical protein